MKKYITLIVCMLFTGLASVSAQIPVNPAIANMLQDKIDDCVTTYTIPGISVSILLPNDRYWNGVSGLSHIYDLTPMDTSHLFYEASVTKLFIATILFQMVEENLISLNDTVGMYLNPIVTVPSSTQVRYLLNHRSGLYDVFWNSGPASNWFIYPDSIWTPRQVIETYNDNPVFTQGAAFSYSNTNYLVLGMLIEEISGNSLATELTNRILIPYNLNNTFFLPEDEVIGTITKGWTSFTTTGVYDTDASIMLNDCFASMVYAAGALVSYPQDIAKFNHLLFTGQILNATSLNTMKIFSNISFSDGCNGYGYGLMRYTFAGKDYYGHSGDMNGFTQMTIHEEVDDVTLTLSINRNNAPRGSIALEILTTLAEAMALAIDENELTNSAYTIYPNPTKGKFVLDINNPGNLTHEVTIYNTLGKKVYSNLLPSTVNEHSFNLEGKQSGVYFIKVSNATDSITKQLILN